MSTPPSCDEALKQVEELPIDQKEIAMKAVAESVASDIMKLRWTSKKK
jgi:hypothetical protein